MFGMHPMRVVLQSVLCGAKVSTLGARVSSASRVLRLNVIVQVGGLGDQVAHCALPLTTAQCNHHRTDFSFDIWGVCLCSIAAKAGYRMSK